ncbi:Hypothetical protein GLP15_3436 [Giardia lamblia P15]|uniref:Uncharacterized protein n=1 Tax=Giardia intestinalis (strain P15) TaxID=658858 RepID=E1F0B0_GIAIA|nr:Hypothetical protein GLP15_3436 [Giardia lamblia P15]
MYPNQVEPQRPAYLDTVRNYPAKVKKGTAKDAVPEYTLKYNQDSIVVPLSEPSRLHSNYSASCYSTYQSERSRYGRPASGLAVLNASSMHGSKYDEEYRSNYVPTSLKNSCISKPVEISSSHAVANPGSSPSIQPTSIKAAQGSFINSTETTTTRVSTSSRQVTSKDYLSDNPYAPRSSNIDEPNDETSPSRKPTVPKSFVHPGHGESTYLIDYIPPAKGGIADTIVYSRRIHPDTWTNSDRVDGGTGGQNISAEYSQNYIAVRIDGKDYLAQLTPFDGSAPNHLRNSLPLLELAEETAHAEVVPDIENCPKTPKLSKKERDKTPKKDRARTPKSCGTKTLRK